MTLNFLLMLNRISHSFASLTHEISLSILEINFIFCTFMYSLFNDFQCLVQAVIIKLLSLFQCKIIELC